MGNTAVSKNPAVKTLRDVCESVIVLSLVASSVCYKSGSVASSVCYKSGSAAMQKVDDQICRRLGLLFRDPVPAIRDDHVFDVIGDAPHHRADHRAECSFTAEAQDRHPKPALCKKRSVVSRILAEGQELGEARSHCAGLRIERRIMPAFRFIKPI